MTTSPTRTPRVLRTIVLLCVPVSLICAAVGCGNPTPAAPTQSKTGTTQRFEAVAVETADLIQTVTVPGTVEGLETVDLFAKVGGFLKEIRVDIGDEIEEGQPLAILDIPEMAKQLDEKIALKAQADAHVEQAKAGKLQADANVASAEATYAEVQAERTEKFAQLRYRESEYKKYVDLVELRSARDDLRKQAEFQRDAARAALGTAGARIKTADAMRSAAQASLAKAIADIAGARAQVQVAQAEVDVSREMIKYATIRAPFAGRVTRRWFDPGAFIQPAEGNSASKPLLTVTRTDEFRIIVDIPMDKVRWLDKGDHAVLDNISVLPLAKPFPGVVNRFSAALNMQSRMMRVEIKLDNTDEQPAGSQLRPGYYGSVTLYLHKRPEMLKIPSSAIVPSGDETLVFVVRNGKAWKQVVTPIHEDGIDVYLEPGDLKSGDQVVLSPGDQITDGAAIETNAE